MASHRASLPLFVAAEGLSLFGNSAMGIVLPWLVLSRTGDPAAAGMVAGIAGVPAILATLASGQLIDRIGQRRMSVLADIGSALSVAALAVVDLAVGLGIGWFVVLGVLGALFDVPGMTARETLMGRVSATSRVPTEKVAALRQSVFGLSFLAGPALAGVLLALLDPIDVVWLTAGCSAAAAACTALMPLVASAPEPVDVDPPRGGLDMLRRSAALRAMVVVGFGGALVTAPLVAVLLPAHFSGLDRSDWLGYTMSMFAVGTIAGSALYGFLAGRSRRALYLAAIVLQTLGMAGFASLYGFWPVAIGSLVVGLGGGLLSPVFLVYFTEQVPESVRGRVLALVNALSLIASPVGLGLLALLLTSASIQVGAWATLAVWVVVAVYALASRAMWAAIDPGSPQAAPTAEDEARDDVAAHD